MTLALNDPAEVIELNTPAEDELMVSPELVISPSL